jgi:hypothetical protein
LRTDVSEGLRVSGLTLAGAGVTFAMRRLTSEPTKAAPSTGLVRGNERLWLAFLRGTALRLVGWRAHAYEG